MTDYELKEWKHLLEPMWNQAEAVKLCRAIEAFCPDFGCHVALTGGLLYKHGLRKDADILFYRIRQRKAIDVDGLFEALAGIGVYKTSGFGFVHKATYDGKSIDFMFPEENGNYYKPEVKDDGKQRDPHGLEDSLCF